MCKIRTISVQDDQNNAKNESNDNDDANNTSLFNPTYVHVTQYYSQNGMIDYFNSSSFLARMPPIQVDPCN